MSRQREQPRSVDWCAVVRAQMRGEDLARTLASQLSATTSRNDALRCALHVRACNWLFFCG